MIMKMKIRKVPEYANVELSNRDILEILAKTFDKVFDFHPEYNYIKDQKVCYDDNNYHNPIAVESRKATEIDEQLWNIYTRIKENLND